MKKISLLFIVAFSTSLFSQVGINTEEPTEALDINGKARIRNTEVLTSGNVSSLYVDENGVVGKTNISPNSPQTTYLSGGSNVDIVSDFNAGNTITISMTTSQLGLNTLNAELTNNTIKIPSTGVYQLAASINVLLSTGTSGQNVYMAVNVQRSSNDGTTWNAISGTRPIFAMIINGSLYYNTVLPTILVDLNENDLIRLVVYRTSGTNGTQQGAPITTGTVSPNSQHGTRAYTLSISKF